MDTATNRVATRQRGRGPARGRFGLALRLAGAGLLLATAGIHLDLYLTGYRTIPVIGWLFLISVISGIGLAAIILVTPEGARLRGVPASRLAGAAGAAFALGTLAGYLITLQFGLFGFREVRTTAGLVAGVLEVAAFAVLAVYAAGPGLARGLLSATAGVTLAALALLGLGLAANGAAASGSSGYGSASAGTSGATAGLRAAMIGGTRVLTNAAGRTLYWFAPDSSTRSVCTGSCAVYWPPVAGPVKAAAGVPGKIGTIIRAGGARQATYDGHPLYTYVGDSGPGQAHGNNLNLNGGLWHEVVVAP